MLERAPPSVASVRFLMGKSCDLIVASFLLVTVPLVH